MNVQIEVAHVIFMFLCDDLKKRACHSVKQRFLNVLLWLFGKSCREWTHGNVNCQIRISKQSRYIVAPH